MKKPSLKEGFAVFGALIVNIDSDAITKAGGNEK
jgi:hypothetical protein